MRYWGHTAHVINISLIIIYEEWAEGGVCVFGSARTLFIVTVPTTASGPNYTGLEGGLNFFKEKNDIVLFVSAD